MNNKNLRSLNFIGGGGRGYLAFCILKNIINLSNLTFQQFMSLFPVITGTSIGGIIALALAYGKTLDEIEPLFTKGRKIFSIDTTDNNRPSIITKGISSLLNDAWYKSPSTYSKSLPESQKYGHLYLYELLDDVFGNATMSSLQKKVVITSYRASNKQMVLFSNYDDKKYFTYNNEKIVDVAKATSAAPFYLPEVTIGAHRYWDGGLGVNDPTEMGIILNSVLNPNYNAISSLNISTGIGFLSYTEKDQEGHSSYVLSNVTQLLNVVMGCAELYSDYKLSILQDRLASSFYTKANYFHKYKAAPFYIAELDDCSEATMLDMKRVADEYCTAETTNIKTFLTALMI